ncbi:hypothetical protein K239x_29990 [Planctomycetes bacterium K23_9]|uniref:Uncharacterized protein n=1 Tax=Stieleria marina TaxID=1930275 RepID=A0A517NV57_9BACT|nr:hypothetical protein K239x_01660 [Planctomycetes bacterium K23_9]QDT11006.1 hypothetical protein K239x_29990 [Planctomycetes bacterium K23_9]
MPQAADSRLTRGISRWLRFSLGCAVDCLVVWFCANRERQDVWGHRCAVRQPVAPRSVSLLASRLRAAFRVAVSSSPSRFRHTSSPKRSRPVCVPARCRHFLRRVLDLPGILANVCFAYALYRVLAHAHSSSIERNILGPRLEIRPLRSVSPDWYCLGVMPR